MRTGVGPERGAQCGSSARWDLCGGPPERAVPTATVDDPRGRGEALTGVRAGRVSRLPDSIRPAGSSREERQRPNGSVLTPRARGGHAIPSAVFSSRPPVGARSPHRTPTGPGSRSAHRPAATGARNIDQLPAIPISPPVPSGRRVGGKIWVGLPARRRCFVGTRGRLLVRRRGPA